MDDLEELSNIDLNILQSTQSSDDKLHLFNEDLEFIDRAIDSLNSELSNQYPSNGSINVVTDRSDDDNNLHIYSKYNTDGGFKFASGKKVKTDIEQLKRAKNFLGLFDFSISKSDGEGTNGTLDSINDDDLSIKSSKTPTNECFVTLSDRRIKRPLFTSNENNIEDISSSSSVKFGNNTDIIEFGTAHLSGGLFNNFVKYPKINSTNDLNRDDMVGFNGFSTAISSFNKGSFSCCKLNIPNNKQCHADTDSKFMINWLKSTDCNIGRLTLDKLVGHWLNGNNPFTIRFNNIYDFKFIVPNLQKCYHRGGISDIRECFKIIFNCNYTTDLTKWITHQYKILAYKECIRYRKKIYMLMKSQNYTLVKAINNVELPNPYRILKKVFKRYELERSGFRSIFKLLFEGDESKNQSILVEIVDIVDGVIYLSDGMYCIKAKADDNWVAKLINNRLLRPGVKIIIDELIRSSEHTAITDTSPHLLANDEYISLKYNLIRKANTNVVVGKCPKFVKNIYDIKIGGGNVSLIDIVVLKGLPKTYLLIDKQGKCTKYKYEDLAYKYETGEIGMKDSEIISKNHYIIIDYSFYSNLNKLDRSVSDINKFTNKLHNSIAYLSFKNISDHIDEELTMRPSRLRLSLVIHGNKSKTYHIEHLKHIKSSDVDPNDFLRCRYNFSQTGQLTLYINTRSTVELMELTKDNIFSLPDKYCDIPTSVYTVICGIPVLSFTHYTIQYRKSYPTEYHIKEMCQLCNIDIGLFSSNLLIQTEYTNDNYCIDILPGLASGQNCSILGLPFYVTELETIAFGFKGDKSLYIRIFIQTFTLDIVCIKVTTYASIEQYEQNEKHMLKLKQKLDSKISTYKSQIYNNVYEIRDKWVLLENLTFSRYDNANGIFQFDAHLDKMVITGRKSKHLELEQQYLNVIWNNIRDAFADNSSIKNTSKKDNISVKYIRVVLNNMLRVGHICCANEHYMRSCVECLSVALDQI